MISLGAIALLQSIMDIFIVQVKKLIELYNALAVNTEKVMISVYTLVQYNNVFIESSDFTDQASHACMKLSQNFHSRSLIRAVANRFNILLIFSY